MATEEVPPDLDILVTSTAIPSAPPLTVPVSSIRSQGELPAQRGLQRNVFCSVTSADFRSELSQVCRQMPGDKFAVGSAAGFMIQDGPKCGLIALVIAVKMLCAKQHLNLDEVFGTALSRSFTNYGEMFSADWLSDLVKAISGCDVDIISVTRRDSIVEAVLAGRPVLVPYDNDKNFEPCHRRGTKSHWGVICGLALWKKSASDLEGGRVEIHLTSEPLTVDQKSSFKDILLTSDDLKVLVRQGKSKRLHAWSYTLLVSSNMQLHEHPPKPDDSNLPYRIPDGGLSQGICGRALVLYAPRLR